LSGSVALASGATGGGSTVSACLTGSAFCSLVFSFLTSAFTGLRLIANLEGCGVGSWTGLAGVGPV
jgi:hypothetical protein